MHTESRVRQTLRLHVGARMMYLDTTHVYTKAMQVANLVLSKVYVFECHFCCCCCIWYW